MTIDRETLRERLATDPELLLKIRGFSGVVRIGPSGDAVDVVIADGTVEAVRPGDEEECDVTFRAPDRFWQETLVPLPAPGFESTTGGMATGLSIAGDLVANVAPYLGAWDRMLTLLRETVVGRGLEVEPQADPFADTDTAVGRYARYGVEDVEYRVYYEEAGEGEVPVVLLHTAGADGRQYRHVLADPDLQQRYRLIAMDLPYHGRSLPPTGVRWWERQYRPGRELLMSWVVGLIEALELDRPIFVGCSVGGQLASDLCAHRPESIRGAIGINGLHNMAPYEGAFDNDQFRDPRVPTEYYAAMNFGATSPLAPEPFKRELYWIYRSNFPGVYAGDNEYYMFEHDLRVDGDRIDTSRTPLLMLTGQFDASSLLPEANALRIAAEVPGATAETMDGLGHFAPTDDPLGFRRWFNPALDELVRRATAASPA